MDVRKRKYAGRTVALLLMLPFVVFSALLTLLYLPPVQHWAVERAARVASDATGMDIRVGRIRLAFPLDLALHNVVAFDSLRADTLASVGELRTGVALWPLLRGRVEVSGVGLSDVVAHTGSLIPSVRVDGRIGRLRLKGGDVNLTDEVAEVESLMLREADVSLTLHPDTAERDTASSPVGWKILLRKADLGRVDFRLQMPADTLNLAAGWQQAELGEVAIDLRASAYGAGRLALAGGFVSYNDKASAPLEGFDPHHIAATGMELSADSLLYKGKEVCAVVRQLVLHERSGFRLTHTEGEIRMDASGIRLPYLGVKTDSSAVEAKGRIPWAALKENGTERMDIRVEGKVAMADVARLYPMEVTHDAPLNFRLAMQGNMKRLQLDTLSLQMDSVLSMGASGEAKYLADDARRTARVAWRVATHDLAPLMPLMGSNPSVQIPREMAAEGTLTADRTRYDALLTLRERDGLLAAKGHYDTRLQEYALRVRADSLALHRFLPQDSLGHLTARVRAVGRGTDPYAATTRLLADVHIDSLQYGAQLISGVALKASLEQHRAQATLESHNTLLEMRTRVDGLLHRDSLMAEAVVEVAENALPALRMMDMPMAASARVEMRPDSLYARLSSGDFDLRLTGAEGLRSLTRGIPAFVQTLQTQLEGRRVDIARLKSLLPAVQLSLKTGKENPLTDYLRHTSGLSLERAEVEIGASPHAGLFVDGNVFRLRTDSLEFDTVKVEVTTTESPALVAGVAVSNAPNQRKPSFMARLGSELTDSVGTASLHFHNGKGELGLELGARASVEAEGLRFSFFPERPTIGFRRFELNDSNFIALSDSGRIEADVRLLDKAGTGLRLYSTPNDEALQDLTADLTRLNLGEILTVLPYAPDISGWLNAELHYVKSLSDNTFSGTLQADDLSYGGYPLGTLGMEAAYLPTSAGRHIVNLQLLRDDELIATVDGTLRSPLPASADSSLVGQTTTVAADVLLDRFPIEMANAFVPRDILTMGGWLGGELSVKGAVSAPRIDGEVRFDSVQLHSPLYALDLHMDKTPVSVDDNRLIFDNFHIYAKGKNPFSLTGRVDLGNFSRMTADLQMRAVEYELLNAKKNRNSVLHGRVFVSLFSTIKGELTSPVIRGTMNVLGNTDVTYVLKESPLTVEDRLGSMVTFVNFNDTLAAPKPKEEVTLGGVDMLLGVQIDQGAQVRVDLGSDNYVEVQGGGDLSMQYTPQGDLLLTGRYTLTSGQMKYSLPVIPLKTFKISGGSYVEFTGDPANPDLNITATERVRTSVTEDNSSRYVNFDVGVSITNSLDNMGVAFTLDAPEDVSLQNQLAAMSAEERGKLAVTMLVTGMYAGGQGTGGGFNTSNALNSFLQSEISSIAGSALKTVDVSIGVEDNYAADGTTPGGTDYSFRFAKRFWNNRLSVIIGGRISTGNEAVAEGEGSSFIDDISLEWRLDDSGTRYVKLFHTRNYESILEGEIIETGVGLVLRRKVNKFGELFIFRRKE